MQSITFPSPPGTTDTSFNFQIPDNVTSINIIAIGGGGGADSVVGNSGNGGSGGRVTTTFNNIVNGTILHISIGGGGSASDQQTNGGADGDGIINGINRNGGIGYSDAGDGGAMTRVTSNTSIIKVIAGGGGGGSSNFQGNGGAGGGNGDGNGINANGTLGGGGGTSNGNGGTSQGSNPGKNNSDGGGGGNGGSDNFSGGGGGAGYGGGSGGIFGTGGGGGSSYSSSVLTSYEIVASATGKPGEGGRNNTSGQGGSVTISWINRSSPICICPKPAIPKQGISFGGNMNIPGHTETASFRYAQQVKIASTSREAGTTLFLNASTNRSSNPPPRNSFN